MIRFWFPFSVCLLWLILALFGPLLPITPDVINLEHILSEPSLGAWLGYDDLGRPLLDRVIVGARYSFFIALIVVTISLTVGTVIGAVSAYLGGWFDHMVVRIIDVFLAFPGILLAIAMAGLMGPGFDNVIISLSVVSWVGFARLSRAQVMSYKRRDHVAAAVTLGTTKARIIGRHLLPLIIAPLIIEGTFAIAGTVIAEAGLSFLGLGIQPPTPSWGSMIRDGSRYMLVSPHMVMVPGIAMVLVVLSVNMLGDRLRDRLDVTNRERS